MSTSSHVGCPYSTLPDHAYWRKAVAEVAPEIIAPIVAAPFKIARTDQVATAGSCFAQHLAKRLQAGGFSYFVAESGYPRMAEDLAVKYNYGVFSARFGNIYTARQLRQLFARALGEFVPAEPLWQDGAHWRDPFRPMTQPHGFESRQEAELDRAQHLDAVRGMMESLDVFIFTLGLTESWVCRADGAVLPMCPGCGAGTFDPEKYEFRNFEVEEVIDDLRAALEQLRRANPSCRVIFTVSPVPLVATYSGNHVLSATTYSKSVLRVAADRMAREFGNCSYFPSYEIITGAFNGGTYFADDLRNVTEAGVDHVMNMFFRHFAAEPPNQAAAPSVPTQRLTRRGRNVLEVVCDEYASLNAAEQQA